MTKILTGRIILLPILATLFISFAIDVAAATSDVDPGFNPKLTRTVPLDYGSFATAAQQPDGKWILLGTAYLNGRFILRVNADGSYDPTFECPSCESFNTTIAAVQPDGKVLVGGDDKLIRVHPNGSLDTTFKITFASNGCSSRFIIPLAGGKTLLHCRVGGTSGSDKIRRLNDNGSVDSTFTDIDSVSFVTQMFLQADGKIFVAGGVLKRFNGDGTLDSSFTATPGGGVYGAGQLPDGRYIVAGTFSQINGVPKQGYARLFNDGSVDASLSIPPGPNDWPQAVRTLPDGRFYIWTFKNFVPNPSPARFVRYNTDGTVDNTFTQLTLNQTYYWDVDAQGRIVTFRNGPPGLYTRLNFDGSIDNSFAPVIVGKGGVLAAAVQSDGKVVVSGNFEKLNGVAMPPFVRLNSDGTHDSTFNVGTGFNLPPEKLLIQPDGKIVACGLFAGYNGSWRSNVARINPDGSVDSFNPTIDGKVSSCALLPDGKLVIVGEFSTVNGISRPLAARLNPDGSLDATFNPVFNTANPNVFTALAQADGMFLIGGSFGRINGHTTNGIARFLADGNIDTGFVAGTSRITAIARRADGKYIVATRNVGGNDSAELFRLNSNGSRDWGSFTPRNVSGFNTPADILIQPSGNILYSAPSPINIERIGPNGEADVLFPTFGANAWVRGFAAQPDGKVIIVGSFSGIEDAARSGIARLTLSNRMRATPFDYDGDGRSDISVFRPSTSTWYEILSGTWSIGVQTFGAAGDKIVPADYDADGKTDIAIYRPSTHEWMWIDSSTNTFRTRVWGIDGDIPLSADLGGEGQSALIVYRPSTSQWFWVVGNGGSNTVFGLPGDQPLLGDFDGDARADVAVFRPSTGQWWYAASSAGGEPRASQWGLAGDIPVPGDYDGDSKTDHAIFRPSDGGWYIYNSSNGSYTALQFGTNGDIPAPGDYDGDGKMDIAIFRPSTGIWYLWQSTSGFAGLQFGLNGDRPTPSAFLP